MAPSTVVSESVDNLVLDHRSFQWKRSRNRNFDKFSSERNDSPNHTMTGVMGMGAGLYLETCNASWIKFSTRPF